MKKISIITLFFIFLFGCEENPYGLANPEGYDKLIINTITDISWHDCVYDSQDKVLICLDSVLGDSRCPKGVYCFWEGNAEVKFKFEKSPDEPVYFTLNTHRGFTYETVIGGYKITLKGLSPYPEHGRVIPQKDYKAEILVERI